MHTAIDVRHDAAARADLALARSAAYRLASQLLAYPTPETSEELVVEDLPFAEAVTGPLPARVRRAIRGVRSALEGVDARGLEAEHRRIFSHVHSTDCPLYETDFVARDVWRQSQQLADLAGFYGAFGVRVVGERPDGAAVELEFLHVLAFKTAWALTRGEEDHVDVCDRAERAFLDEHVLRWLPSSAERIGAVANGGLYGAAARLIGEVLGAEAARRGLVYVTGAEPSRAVGLGAEEAGLCEAEP